MADDRILANGVSEILKRLSILVAKEIGLAWGVKKEIQKLKKTVDMIMSVMDDAEKKEVKNESVRKWLGELKDIAYEAEDILDECAYEDLRHRMTRERDRYLSFDSNPVTFGLQIAHEIKDINNKLNEHAMLKEMLGLQMLELSRKSGPTDHDESSKLREVRETDSIVDSSLKIIGRDKDKSNIIKMLLHNNDSQNQDGNIEVISIVGMGGLGKTTLAQLIYNDDAVTRHFQFKIWVCVNDDFDVKKLYIKIIESTQNTCQNVSNIDVIARKLQDCLRGKKYLLVLDDVWNKKPEEWVRLKKPLLIGGSGSKILVTTRNEEVASIMGGKLNSYKLGILKADECWSLFKERVFGCASGVVETQSLRAVGKELVQKCAGLPLALIFLISLLRYKDENQWSVINKNEIWNQQNDDETRILPILKLSYDHLPPHLKQCFSYFSIFEKGYTFNRKTMILFWMAEGFLLQPSRGNDKSMEEVGNDYFNSLLGNSFFENVEKDVFGKVESFSIHDLVNDLAKHVAGNSEVFGRLKLSVESEGRRLNEIMAGFHNKSKLRTLLVEDESIPENNAFDGIKRLRVLSLCGYWKFVVISLSSISNLKHLRYLCLSVPDIERLPKSVTSLYHLQTLDLRNCQSLNELPEGIKKLISLRHLYLPRDNFISIPRVLGELSSLQTLYPFNVCRPGGRREPPSCGVEILEGLNLLNDCMKINCLQNVTSGVDAQRANLKEKKYLNRIVLNWRSFHVPGREDDGDEDEAVLEALQPHPNLKSLEINEYFGAKLPRWMGDPSCLQSLTNLELTNCRKCQQVVEFGKLPSLKKLKLYWCGIKCLGDEFYGNCGGGGGGGGGSSSTCEAAGVSVVLFPSLKELVIQIMFFLEEWVDIQPSTTTVNYSCFPCLEKIEIDFCYNLRITPTRFPSVKKLSLRAINERVAVPLITTNLNSLDSVYLCGISELRFLPHRLLQGSNLKELDVFGCDDFQGFDQNEEEKEEKFTSLKVLRLHILRNLEFLPDIRSFTSLENLFIEDCPSLKPLPEDLTCLSSSLKHLKKVHIKNVKEVEDFEWENVMGEIAEEANENHSFWRKWIAGWQWLSHFFHIFTGLDDSG